MKCLFARTTSRGFHCKFLFLNVCRPKGAKICFAKVLYNPHSKKQYWLMLKLVALPEI
jgi:hypothetical protein